MKRGTLVGMLALLAALLAGPAGALAGGWATVTLDSLPAEARAGESFEIGFTVRQHGATPTNDVKPTVALTDPATKQSIYFAATQQGAVGHFVAAITVPAAGVWQWEVIPAPFAGTQLVALSVAPPLPAAEAASAAQPATAPAAAPAGQRSPAIWWISGGLLLAAVGATGLALRNGSRRRDARPEAAGPA